LRRSATSRLCACTSYSVFKEPTSQARVHPASQAPNSRPLAVFGGTFLHYYSHLVAVKQRSTSIPVGTCRSHRGDVAEPWRRLTPTQMSKNLPSCVLLGSPGRPGSLGTDEPKEQPNIRAEGGCVNPSRSPMLEGYLSTLSAGAAPRRATHVKAASHTAANVHANPRQLTGSSACCQTRAVFRQVFLPEPGRFGAF